MPYSKKDGHNIQYSNEVFNQFCPSAKLEKDHIHCCSKCFDNKNVVVAPSDVEIYSIVQGDMKTTNRLCQKKSFKYYYFKFANFYG